MITSLISIANSKEVRVPKSLLKQSGLDGEVEIKVKKGEIKIVSASSKNNSVLDTMLLSEKTLGVDWNRPEEDEAWASLQSGK